MPPTTRWIGLKVRTRRRPPEPNYHPNHDNQPTPAPPIVAPLNNLWSSRPWLDSKLPALARSLHELGPDGALGMGHERMRTCSLDGVCVTDVPDVCADAFNSSGDFVIEARCIVRSVVATAMDRTGMSRQEGLDLPFLFWKGRLVCCFVTSLRFGRDLLGNGVFSRPSAFAAAVVDGADVSRRLLGEILRRIETEGTDGLGPLLPIAVGASELRRHAAPLLLVVGQMDQPYCSLL